MCGRCPGSKQNIRPRRQCGGRARDLLPYVRPCEAPYIACRDNDQLHAHIAYKPKLVLGISTNTAGSTAPARFITNKHHPPSCCALSPVPGAIPVFLRTSKLNIAIPTRTAGFAAKVSNASDSDPHSPTDIISTAYGPCSMDGDSLRRRVRAVPFPILACTSFSAIGRHYKRRGETCVPRKGRRWRCRRLGRRYGVHVESAEIRGRQVQFTAAGGRHGGTGASCQRSSRWNCDAEEAGPRILGDEVCIDGTRYPLAGYDLAARIAQSV
jgi:hypothetical protein